MIVRRRMTAVVVMTAVLLPAIAVRRLLIQAVVGVVTDGLASVLAGLSEFSAITDCR